MSNRKKPDELEEKLANIFALFFALLFLGAIISFVLWIYGWVSPFHGYTDKKNLTISISKAISNDADLDAIKTIFDNRDIENSFYTRVITNDDGKYKEPLILITVLEDMRADFYEGEQKLDIKKLDEILNEHKEVSPFDRLLPHQKGYFSNIRIKSREEYKLIEDDVLKLSEEISRQNDLVNKYLSDSQLSLIISVVGLIIAVGVSLMQIFQNRKIKKESNSPLGLE